MSERVLLRDYTAEEMDRGEGMAFHPCGGLRRVGEMFKTHGFDAEVLFDPKLHTFVVCAFPLECIWERYSDARSLYEFLMDGFTMGRIGDGKPHSAGTPYCTHWEYDPYTGEELNPDPPCCGGEW